MEKDKLLFDYLDNCDFNNIEANDIDYMTEQIKQFSDKENMGLTITLSNKLAQTYREYYNRNHIK